MTGIHRDWRVDWRVVDGTATAWFDASSLRQAAALGARVLELGQPLGVDLRASGVRVRLEAAVGSDAVSAAARDLGLAPDPSALQRLSIVFDTADPPAAQTFWQRVLGHPTAQDGRLTDPLGRDPSIRFQQSSDPRPLRSRIHLDVVRPAAAVEQADLGEPFGPFGVRYADPDGNEVDLVPGGALGEQAATADWQEVWGAMACYRVASVDQQRDLAAAAAALADDAGFPLLVDLRPGLVVIDSGKDQWDVDAHGLDVDFTDLARRIQSSARELGARVDPGLPRLVQVFLDAADVVAVRAFWAAALGYTPDCRTGLSDIHDPRRLDPVLAFQQIDVSDTARRRQRNRIHLELAVPSDLARTRLATALATGGRPLEESEGRWRVADPEGNELVIVGRS